MNIFWLAKDPDRNARAHVDKHVVKMPLEAAQIASTALWLRGVRDEGLYRPTHKNHPCVVWAASSRAALLDVLFYGEALCQEYAYRYDRHHRSMDVIDFAWIVQVHTEMNDDRLPPPPQCVPEQYRHRNPITAYRRYYIGEKQHIARWTRREPPKWWVSSCESW